MTARSLQLPAIPRHAAWWLLAAGWFCLTLPAPFWSSVVAAIHASTHFSHQARLEADIAAILHAPGGRALRTAAPAPQPAHEQSPAASADFAFLKFTLPHPVANPLGAVSPAPQRLRPAAWLLPDRIVGDVPCPPPRMT